MSDASLSNEGEAPRIGEDGLRSRLDGAYREADRILVSVSSGVLALSVSLVSKENLCDLALWAIRIDWLLFLTTILIVLRGLYVEQLDKKARLDAGGKTTPEIKKMTEQLKNLNKAALWTFGVGMLTLFVFLLLATWQ